MIFNIISRLFIILVSIFLWPFVIIVFGINELIRCFISLRLWKSGTHLVNDGYENVFQCKSTWSGRTVISFFYSCDPLHLDNDINKFRTALLRTEPDGSLTYAKLMKKPVLKFGYWCYQHDEKFKIENHVKYYDMSSPKGGKDYFTEAEINEDVLPRVFGDLPRSKSQWEWLLVPRVLREDGSMGSLRILRFNHGLMDGLHAGLLVAEDLFDWTANGEKQPPFYVNPKTLNFSWVVQLQIWLAFFYVLLISPWLLFTGMIRSFRCLKWSNHGPFAVTKPYSGKNVFAISEKFDLSLINRIKDGAPKGVGVPSILTTAFQNPLAKILEQRGGFEKNKEEVSIGLAVNTALPPIVDNKPKNHFSAIGTTLRLRKDGIRKWVKVEPGLELYFLVAYPRWIGRLPMCLTKRLFGCGTGAMSNSNLPFFKEEGRIGGSRITDIMAFSINPAPEGIGSAMVVYNGSARMIIYTVEEILNKKEVEAFVQNYMSELHDMERTSRFSKKLETLEV